MTLDAPVRPHNPPKPPGSTGGGADADPRSIPEESKQEEEEVNMKHAIEDASLVGVEGVLFDEKGPGARQAKPLPSPPTMTPCRESQA